MSAFTFRVEIVVTNDMQGESGEEFAKNELSGDLDKLPHNWRIRECINEEAEESSDEE